MHLRLVYDQPLSIIKMPKNWNIVQRYYKKKKKPISCCFPISHYLFKERKIQLTLLDISLLCYQLKALTGQLKDLLCSGLQICFSFKLQLKVVKRCFQTKSISLECFNQVAKVCYQFPVKQAKSLAQIRTSPFSFHLSFDSKNNG